MSKLYGVFIQFEPTYKYDEHLQSIWTTKVAAEAAAKEEASNRCRAEVREIYPNSSHFETNPDDLEKWREEYFKK